MNSIDNECVWHPYARIPNEVQTHTVMSANGVYLTLDSDKKIIDGM